MENASKALLIAGAILVAILIISLGIMVYRNTAGTVNENAQSAMSDYDVQQFNSKFTQYEGSKVRGAQVNAMLNTVLSHNTSSTTNKVSVNGTITLQDNASTIATLAETGKTYTVKCGYSSGRVNTITVTVNP